MNRFRAEAVNTAAGANHVGERIRIEAGLFHGEPRIEVAIRYEYDSGRTRGCFSYITLTPEQCFELADVLVLAGRNAK